MRRAKFISLVMLFVVSVAIAPPLARAVESDTGATASGAQIAELIKNAKTAQDHLKIAQYFDKEAKRAEQRARDSALRSRDAITRHAGSRPDMPGRPETSASSDRRNTRR